MSGFSFTLWCFLAAAAVLSQQLSAAPRPAPKPIEGYVQSSLSTADSMSLQGQQYGNYAMNEAQAQGQYVTDEMKMNGQLALNSGKNLYNKAQNSIGNISLNPLSYMPSWMKPDAQTLSNLAQNANYYAQKGNEIMHNMEDKGKEMLKSAQEQGSNLLQRGMENGQYYLEKAKEKGYELSDTMKGMASSGIGYGKQYTKEGMQHSAKSIQAAGGYEKSFLGSLGDKLDAINGVIAEKIYKSADGVDNMDLPNLDQQMSSSY